MYLLRSSAIESSSPRTRMGVPERESVYSVMPSGSGLMQLNEDGFLVGTGVTFAPAPDGHGVAVDTGAIWVVDLSNGAKRRVVDDGA